MKGSRGNIILALLSGIALVSMVIFAPKYFETTYSSEEIVNVNVPPEEEVFKVTHIETPASLKALYMTACVAGTPTWRDSLKKLIDETELNSIVLDIKDYTGVVSIPNNFPKTNSGKGCVVADMKEFIGMLHDADIYVIGRVSVFQDPSYASIFPELAVKSKASGGVWKDNKGLAFVDVGAKPYWDYIIELSKASYEIGFDEINFDYVRYPSDGNMKDTNFTWTVGTTTKADMLKGFFEYLSNNLENVGVKTSVDLFGMTTTVTVDMGIGQLLENAMPYFDYIAPMVYPSHYPKTWNGFANPAEKPYEVIKISMGSAVKREEAWRVKNGIATSTPSKMRPWIQDFNLGATYDATKVKAQIQATYDVGLTSWMLWNAGNKYTRDALLSE